jgi:hypothetical protein
MLAAVESDHLSGHGAGIKNESDSRANLGKRRPA